MFDKFASEPRFDFYINDLCMKGENMVKDLVEYITKALVDSPDSVNVNVIEGQKSIILELRVTQDDIGKVIGKNGRIAQAIRMILSSVAAKTDKRVMLEILD